MQPGVSSPSVCQKRKGQRDSEETACPRRGGPWLEPPGGPGGWMKWERNREADHLSLDPALDW